MRILKIVENNNVTCKEKSNIEKSNLSEEILESRVDNILKVLKEKIKLYQVKMNFRSKEQRCFPDKQKPRKFTTTIRQAF